MARGPLHRSLIKNCAILLIILVGQVSTVLDRHFHEHLADVILYCVNMWITTAFLKL